ncbi:hypothetical protein E2C01_081209 [Portunus trituberculatus]|uniref:Uncharacterized protein n=1 Tax=Portunus trituberculatus TaxID=210409 RepID=A0A5B7J1N2_PORTR|nr:hypothetical protein [Portunus trituberculatus]
MGERAKRWCNEWLVRGPEPVKKTECWLVGRVVRRRRWWRRRRHVREPHHLATRTRLPPSVNTSSGAYNFRVRGA